MRILPVVVIAVVVAVGGGVAWGYFDRREPPRFRTAEVTRGTVEEAVLATGTLVPVITVQVGSELSGRVASISVDFNSAVTAGQEIATIDPASFQGRYDQAASDLAVAEANIAVQQAAIVRAEADRKSAANALEDAEETLGRTSRLTQAGHATERQLQADQLAVTQAHVAVARSDAEEKMAEANLAVARAQVEQKRAAAALAKTDLDRTVIRSPVTGVVVNRQVDVGQTVAASLQAPVLFEIAQDLKDMRLEASVDEADIGRVREGAAVAFTVDAFPDRAFEGTVAQVRKAPTVVSNVTTYTVVVATRNPDLSLLPGMTANVRIIEARRDDALKLPLAALRFRPGRAGGAGKETPATPEAATPPATAGADTAVAAAAAPSEPGARGERVYVVGPEGRPVARDVVTGLASDGEVEILSGLTEGERVIVARLDADGGERPQRFRSPMGF